VIEPDFSFNALRAILNGLQLFRVRRMGQNLLSQQMCLRIPKYFDVVWRTLFALCAPVSSAAAGPHHWLTWKQGIITDVDPARQTLLIMEDKTKERERYRWNQATQFWNCPAPARKAERRCDSRVLVSGERVSILCQKMHGQELAKRIVIDPAAKEPQRNVRR
jgi:hypothetical protein